MPGLSRPVAYVVCNLHFYNRLTSELHELTSAGAPPPAHRFLGAAERARAPMDNTVLAVATIVLGLVGAAVFFLSQPAQAKSRSTGGSMKPRGEGGSNPCNHMAQHALSTLPVFWQTTGTNNEAAASQSNRSTRSKCLDAVVRYGSDPHW